MTARAARWARVSLAGVLVLALTGCLRYHVDLRVSPDERVSGTVVFAVKTTDPNLSPRSEIPEELVGRVASRRYNQDGYLGEEITLDGVTFDEVKLLFDAGSRAHGAGAGGGASPTGAPPGRPGRPSPTARPPASTAPPAPSRTSPRPAPTADGQPPNRSTFTFRRQGGRVRVDGETTFPVFASGSGAKDFDARITLTFPGEVVSTNGQQNGRTVTWTVSPDRPTRIAAVANLTDARPAWVLWAGVGGGGFAVVLVAVLLTWLVRRRRAAVPAGAAPIFDAAEFQTFLDDRSWYPPEQPAPYPPGTGTTPQPPGGPGGPGGPGWPVFPGPAGARPGQPGQPGQPDQPDQYHPVPPGPGLGNPPGPAGPPPQAGPAPRPVPPGYGPGPPSGPAGYSPPPATPRYGPPGYPNGPQPPPPGYDPATMPWPQDGPLPGRPEEPPQYGPYGPLGSSGPPGPSNPPDDEWRPPYPETPQH